MFSLRLIKVGGETRNEVKDFIIAEAIGKVEEQICKHNLVQSFTAGIQYIVGTTIINREEVGSRCVSKYLLVMFRTRNLS